MTAATGLLETVLLEAMAAVHNEGRLERQPDGTWTLIAEVPTDDMFGISLDGADRHFAVWGPTTVPNVHLQAGSLSALRTELRTTALLAQDVNAALSAVSDDPTAGYDFQFSATGKVPPPPEPVGRNFRLVFLNTVTGARLSRALAVEEMSIRQVRNPAGQRVWAVDLAGWMKKQCRAVGVSPSNMVIFRGSEAREGRYGLSQALPLADVGAPSMQTGAGRLRAARAHVHEYFSWLAPVLGPDIDSRSAAAQAESYGLQLDSCGRPVQQTIACRTLDHVEVEFRALERHVTQLGGQISLTACPDENETWFEVQVTVQGQRYVASAQSLAGAVVGASATLGLERPARVHDVRPPRAAIKPTTDASSQVAPRAATPRTSGRNQ